MHIKTIQINNYRRLHDISFELNNNLKDPVIIAGENNSGKTSFIQLIYKILKNGQFTYDDYSLLNRKKANEDFSIIYEKYEEVKNLKESEEKSQQNEQFQQLIYEFRENHSIQVRLEIEYSNSENVLNLMNYLIDLTPNKRSVFFYIEWSLKPDIEWENIVLRNSNIGKSTEDFINNNFDIKYFYTCKGYQNRQTMKRTDFEDLFSIQIISANKEIHDDENTGGSPLSEETLRILKKSEEWNETYIKVAEDTKNVLERNKIGELLKQQSTNQLQDFLSEINKTSGRENLNLEHDIFYDESNVKKLLQEGIELRYIDDNGDSIKEHSQGLGYNNLVKMHLILQDFFAGLSPRNQKSNTVNLFILEEPEAHLHPQMQRVFIRYLTKIINESNKDIQAIITTHSREIVEVMDYDQIIVLKNREVSASAIKPINEGDLNNLLYKINISELIFADKAILYEGDTEKLFLEHLILRENRFERLRNSYLAYIQVGGAYSHKYKDVLRKLQIPTLIITDIDYDKGKNTVEEVKKSTTTNKAFENFLNLQNPTIEQILAGLENQNHDDFVHIVTQGPKDNYSRTLEEAMLNRLDIKPLEVYKPEKWKEIREKKLITIPVPHKEKSSMELVNSRTFKKVDFMYSIIENDLMADMLPKYIEEGLQWLNEQK